MRWIIFILFYAAINFYSYQAIKTLSKNFWVQALFIGLSLIFLGYFLFYWLQPATGSVFTGKRSVAFGLLLSFMAAEMVLIAFLMGEDIIRTLIFLKNKIVHPEVAHLPGRRKFVSTLALGLAAIPFGSLLYGMFKGKYNYKVLTYEINFPDLPEAFDGYQITQISDVHSGSFDNLKKVKYAIDLINQQKSDAIFFTGDLVNNTADEMEACQKLFGELKAKDGVFSVLGNHDYGDYVRWDSPQEKKENLNRLKSIQKQMGWKLLLNEHTYIRKGDAKLAVVGVENWGKGGFVKHGDLDRAAAELSKEEFKILLSHDPSYWQEKIKAHEKEFQLTLSGHTHGMQFGIEIPGWFKWSPVKYRYENWAGLYKEFNRYLYVNRGFGYLAYPGRVGMWPEITVLKLKKASANV